MLFRFEHRRPAFDLSFRLPPQSGEKPQSAPCSPLSLVFYFFN
nr:MAG TPA: hypothetical protein [Caudoviricetes sp.]